MNRLLKFRRIDEYGYALLEDKDGRAATIPLVWMPKNAEPGQTLHAVCVSNEDVSSLFIEIDGEYHANDNE